MPLVDTKWRKHGLKDWSVVRYDAKESLYIVQMIIHFETEEGFNQAFAEDSKETMDDVVNFSSGAPISIVGKVVGVT